MGRRVSRVLWVAAVAVAGAGCAAGGPSTRTDRVGPAFGELRRVVAFRPGGREPGAARDVLDGLAESLRARGIAVVEPPPEAIPALEALRRRLERWEGPILEERAGAVIGVDEEAGAAVRAAGADGVALAYRFPRTAWAPGPRPLEAPRDAERPGPLGALVLVSSRDDVARVTWGGAGGEPVLGPGSPLEAIDALLGVLPAATPEADRAPAP